MAGKRRGTGECPQAIRLRFLGMFLVAFGFAILPLASFWLYSRYVKAMDTSWAGQARARLEREQRAISAMNAFASTDIGSANKTEVFFHGIKRRATLITSDDSALIFHGFVVDFIVSSILKVAPVIPLTSLRVDAGRTLVIQDHPGGLTEVPLAACLEECSNTQFDPVEDVEVCYLASTGNVLFFPKSSLDYITLLVWLLEARPSRCMLVPDRGRDGAASIHISKLQQSTQLGDPCTVDSRYRAALMKTNDLSKLLYTFIERPSFSTPLRKAITHEKQNLDLLITRLVLRFRHLVNDVLPKCPIDDQDEMADDIEI